MYPSFLAALIWSNATSAAFTTLGSRHPVGTRDVVAPWKYKLISDREMKCIFPIFPQCICFSWTWAEKENSEMCVQLPVTQQTLNFHLHPSANRSIICCWPLYTCSIDPCIKQSLLLLHWPSISYTQANCSYCFFFWLSQFMFNFAQHYSLPCCHHIFRNEAILHHDTKWHIKHYNLLL